MRRFNRWVALGALVALSVSACGGSPPLPPSSAPATSPVATHSSTTDAGAVSDTDTDSDGVMDGSDECVHEAEIYNTVEDEDGCPDTGPIVLY